MNLNNGEQKIFVRIDFTAEMELVILHEIEVTKIQDKVLCLIYHTFEEAISEEEPTSRMAGPTALIRLILGEKRVH